METTSQELAVIDNEQFGDLVKLPTILNTNKTRALKAETTVNEKLATVLLLDLTTVDAQVMEAHDTDLADIQGRLKTQCELMEGDRKPHTQFMDSIKSLFTAEEKRIAALEEKVKSLRNKWQSEKFRRAQEEKAKQDKILAIAQAKITVKTAFALAVSNKISAEINRVVNAMNTRFNEQTIESFGEYETILRDYVPVLDGPKFDSLLVGIAVPTNPNLDYETESKPIALSAATDMFTDLAAEYQNKISDETARLLDLVASRKAELEKIAGDAQAAEESQKRIAAEAAQREADALAEQNQRNEQITQNAKTEKLSTHFEVASTAAPVVGMSKGTRQKKIYTFASPIAFLPIIQSFITSDLNSFSIEDLEKKLSFMIKPATDRLNDGTVLEGKDLSTTESFSTTASRKKAS